MHYPDEYGEEEIELPLSHSTDLVEELLSFDADDLELEDASHAGEFMLRKLCALQNWSLEGNKSDFVVARWVEVVLVGDNEAYCRLLNARSHETVTPLTLSHLKRAISAELSRYEHWKTLADGLLPQLWQVWQTAGFSAGEQLPIDEVFRSLQKRYPSLRREYLGIDLNRILAQGHITLNGQVLALYPATSHPHRAFWVYDGDTRQRISAIGFEPALAGLIQI